MTLPGNYAKFAQDASMLAHLLATGDRILAEASPFDTCWGTVMAFQLVTLTLLILLNARATPFSGRR